MYACTCAHTHTNTYTYTHTHTHTHTHTQISHTRIHAYHTDCHTVSHTHMHSIFWYCVIMQRILQCTCTLLSRCHHYSSGKQIQSVLCLLSKSRQAVTPLMSMLLVWATSDTQIFWTYPSAHYLKALSNLKAFKWSNVTVLPLLSIKLGM